MFLFNNSRTCSIVSGLSCALNAFWLLPGSRKGRFTAKEVVRRLLPFSGATRVPEEADARWIVSAFSSGDPAGTFAVAPGALKWRASNCRVENVPSAGNDFANDLFGVQKVLDGARLETKVPAASNFLFCTGFTNDIFGFRMRLASLSSCSWAEITGMPASSAIEAKIIRTLLNVPKQDERCKANCRQSCEGSALSLQQLAAEGGAKNTRLGRRGNASRQDIDRSYRPAIITGVGCFLGCNDCSLE